MQTSENGRWARRVGVIAVLALLIPAGVAGAQPPHKGQGMAGAKTITLSGQIGGTWTQRPDSQGASTEYDLTGNGEVSPLGTVRVAGSLRAHGSGNLTLTAPNGTMTLAISGAAPPAPAAPLGVSTPASPITFTVTGGTGAFAGGYGTGKAQFSMTPQRRPATIRGRMTPHFIIAAIFNLTFSGAAVSTAGPAPAPPASR